MNAFYKALQKSLVLISSTLFPVFCLGQAPLLVISEVMPDPFNVTDAKGEWFELYNPGTSALQLNGYNIVSGNSKHTIQSSSPILVDPGQYFVLGSNEDPLQNGNVKIDYAYSSISLRNTSDTVTITDPNNGVITSLSYGSKHIKAGIAVSFSLDYATFCFATTTYNTTDKGTPGAASDCFVLTNISHSTWIEEMASWNGKTFHVGLQEAEAILYDSHGKQLGHMRSSDMNEGWELAGNYPAGLYLVKLVTKEKEKTYKIVLP